MTEKQHQSAVKAVKKNTASRDAQPKTIETRRDRDATTMRGAGKSLSEFSRQTRTVSISPVADFDLDEFKADFKRKNGIKYTVRDLALAGLSVAVAFLGVWVIYFAFGGK